MKNFSANGSSSIIGDIPDDCQYTKAKDFVGEYPEGVLEVKGLLKTHSEKYNKDQYSLLIFRQKKLDNMDEKYMLMNVPEWYGSKQMEEFRSSGQTAEEYFGGCFIKEIELKDTKNGNQTTNIIIY